MPDMPHSKFWHGSGVIDGEIYVFGGAGDNEENSPGIWKYKPNAGGGWIDLGIVMPESIAAFAYAVAEDASGSKCLYTFGGSDYFTEGSDPVSSLVLKFCPTF